MALSTKYYKKEKAWNEPFSDGNAWNQPFSGGTNNTANTASASTGIAPRANQYANALNSALNKLNGIGKFTYNQKNDPMYQQYAEMYQRNAKLAMQDTVGQAAALTGGYGNSYAETAGQAMYNQQMNQLNDRAIDLYNASLNAYNSYADLAAAQASATMSAYNADQSAINTELSAEEWNADFAENQRQYNEELAYKYQQAQNDNNRWAQEFAYQQSRDKTEDAYRDKEFNYNKYIDDRNYNYQQSRDEIEDERYAKEWKYQQIRDKENDSRYYNERDYERQKYADEIAYQKQRDKVSDQKYADEWAYQKQQNAIANYNNAIKSGYSVDKNGRYVDTDYTKAMRDNDIASAYAQNGYTYDFSTGEATKNESNVAKETEGTKAAINAIDKSLMNYEMFRGAAAKGTKINGTNYKPTQYKNYLEDYIADVVDNNFDKLSDQEIAYIKIYYGLD